MKEIEVKILDINRQEIETKLIELGAKKIFEGELEAIFFDNKESSIRTSKQTFRLRKEENKIFITHKKIIPSKDLKIRDETEIEVSDFEVARKLICAIGFKEISTSKKRRISYKLNNVKIEFDKLLDDQDFVPEFLELESENEESIFEFANILGFKKEDCKAWTGKDVINYYSK